MKRQSAILGAVLALLMGTVLGVSASKNTNLGYISLGDIGPFTQPALDFAEQTFSTTVLDGFDDLARFGVVWWHDGDLDPGPLPDADVTAILDYTESGGAVLLTGAAIKNVTTLGLEKAQARAFGPVDDDGSQVGVSLLDEWVDTPLWDGLESVGGGAPGVGDQIQLNSTGYPVSGDYFDKIWTDFITVAHVWEGGTDYTDRIAAFGYWESGDGKVFNMNWRLPNYHDNNESIGNLLQMTENIIEWLASESAFASVDATGKLATTWAALK